MANGSLAQSVLDDRVADVLRVKMLLELFDEPYTPNDLVEKYVFTEANQQLALDGESLGSF